MRITPGEMRASAGLAAAPPGYTKESPLETRFRAPTSVRCHAVLKPSVLLRVRHWSVYHIGHSQPLQEGTTRGQ